MREREGEKGRERVSGKEEIERSRTRRESVRGIWCATGESGGAKEQEIDRYKGRQ